MGVVAKNGSRPSPAAAPDRGTVELVQRKQRIAPHLFSPPDTATASPPSPTHGPAPHIIARKPRYPVPKMASRGQSMASAVSRLDRAAVNRLFPPSQVSQWPPGYLPASGVAHFLNPQGLKFKDIIECYQDMKVDQRHEMQRDFAADYSLWMRSTLDDYLQNRSEREQRRLRKFTQRDRLAVSDAEVRDLFGLAPKAQVLSQAEIRRRAREEAQAVRRALSTSRSGLVESPPQPQPVGYRFTPYAETQEYAMLPIAHCSSPNDTVQFTTFPQVRNTFHTDFDTMSPLKGLCNLVGDELVLTREFIQELALYLRDRVEDILAKEPVPRHPSQQDGGEAAGDVPAPSVPMGLVSRSGFCRSGQYAFSTETPVVCFFGNGRLAWLLNNSGLLPFPVLPMQQPKHCAHRIKRQQHLGNSDFFRRHVTRGDTAEADRGTSGSHSLAKSYSMSFPCEGLTVGDALRKYRPCLCIVEPHCDRDFISDLRGYHTVREVLLLGQVDSPAFGSFAFPLLSHGTMPGPGAYWAYNDTLQKVAASERIQLPMDPPHVSQGYDKQYLDHISATLIGANDCQAFSNQYRCVSFIRTTLPREPKPHLPQPPAAP